MSTHILYITSDSRHLVSASQNEISIMSFQSNRAKCDAVGCEQEATESIRVSAGKFGSIGLSVCLKCVSKFLEPESRTEDQRWKIIYGDRLRNTRIVDKRLPHF